MSDRNEEYCLVNFWNSSSFPCSFGHVSMQIPGHYISFYPEDINDKNIPLNKELTSTCYTSLKDELDAKGHPTKTCIVYGLNVSAIKSWWIEDGSKRKYQLFENNCATTVYKALCKGNSWFRDNVSETSIKNPHAVFKCVENGYCCTRKKMLGKLKGCIMMLIVVLYGTFCTIIYYFKVLCGTFCTTIIYYFKVLCGTFCTIIDYIKHILRRLAPATQNKSQAQIDIEENVEADMPRIRTTYSTCSGNESENTQQNKPQVQVSPSSNSKDMLTQKFTVAAVNDKICVSGQQYDEQQSVEEEAGNMCPEDEPILSRTLSVPDLIRSFETLGKGNSNSDDHLKVRTTPIQTTEANANNMSALKTSSNQIDQEKSCNNSTDEESLKQQSSSDNMENAESENVEDIPTSSKSEETCDSSEACVYSIMNAKTRLRQNSSQDVNSNIKMAKMNHHNEKSKVTVCSNVKSDLDEQLKSQNNTVNKLRRSSSKTSTSVLVGSPTVQEEHVLLQKDIIPAGTVRAIRKKFESYSAHNLKTK